MKCRTFMEIEFAKGKKEKYLSELRKYDNKKRIKWSIVYSRETNDPLYTTIYRYIGPIRLVYNVLNKDKSINFINFSYIHKDKTIFYKDSYCSILYWYNDNGQVIKSYIKSKEGTIITEYKYTKYGDLCRVIIRNGESKTEYKCKEMYDPYSRYGSNLYNRLYNIKNKNDYTDIKFDVNGEILLLHDPSSGIYFKYRFYNDGTPAKLLEKHREVPEYKSVEINVYSED